MYRLMTLMCLVLTFQFAQAEEPSKLKKAAECECLNEADSPVPMEQSLKNLADKLNLTEPQKPLWETWSQQLLRAHHSKDEFNRTATERRKLPAPERQEKWMASVETHLHAMRESLPALRSLYSSFNDTQRVTFDAEVPFKHGGCGMSSSKATHAQ